MQTVPLILEELGGVTFVANETGIPLTTVHSWKRANFVPRWRVQPLVDLAEKLGKPITADCFPERRADAQGAAA
ncbi:carph-isopro domain-containing protein [uncultured Novosphingobium sp.]|uniref:carph-isopro domain-containing protein n=1 Tax=uncultured Novosphingobium sp. TaxID=292277 RepID=UPI0037492162